MSGELKADLLEIEIVLGQLQAERNKFTQRDPAREAALIGWLLNVGEYRHPIGAWLPSIEKMVLFYGAWWHRFDDPLACPHCKADLRNHDSGPPGKREIGISNGDSIHTWQCPDCGKTWPRMLRTRFGEFRATDVYVER